MKYLLSLSLLLVFFSPCKPTQTFASASLSYYAKVTTNGVFFYNHKNEESKQFEIPKSYFVLLTGDANEEFYSAKYGECEGFVKKSQVVAMDGTPNSPYATKFNFRITSMSGLPIFEEATFESEKILNLEFLEDDIFFYGKFQGQELFTNSTDIWYYCSYSQNNETKYGYVFSYYCDFISPISQNDEYFEEITEKLVFTPEIKPISSKNDTLNALIVLAVVIPVLICLYFFLTPRKTNNKEKPKRAKRRSDYYELSESDLN